MPCSRSRWSGSFSRIGPTIRRRIDHWSPPPTDALAGSTVVVTGPTSGLGLATTRALGSAWRAGRPAGSGRRSAGAPQRGADATHGEARFPTVVADMGSLASVRAAVDADPLVGDPARCRGRQRRGDVRRARRRSRRDRIDLRGPRRRPVRARRRSAAAARANRRLAGHRGDVRRDVYAASRPRRPRIPSRAVLGCPRLRPGQARPGRADARMVAAAGSEHVAFSAMHPGWADTPGLASVAARVPSAHGAAPADARRGRSIRSCGSPATRTPHRRAGASSSTAARDRSIACRRRACRGPHAGACGTSWWR